VKDFRNLRVWERAHRLTLNIYKATGRFPREELYGLTAQMRRCSASIAANLAEGCGKRGNNEFQRYLQISSGSASELDYHLLLSRDLQFLSPVDHNALAKELGEPRRMLTSLILKSTWNGGDKGAIGNWQLAKWNLESMGLPLS
jgi:four helix bundle protein